MLVPGARYKKTQRNRNAGLSQIWRFLSNRAT